MRGEIMYKILDFIEDRVSDQLDFFNAFLGSRYGAGMGEIDSKFRVKNQKREKGKLERNSRRYLQKYLYKLKREGFISEDHKNKISISMKGQERLKLLRRNKIP